MFPAASADCESCTIGTWGTGGLLHCQDEMLLTVMSRRNTGRPGLCATPERGGAVGRGGLQHCQGSACTCSACPGPPPNAGQGSLGDARPRPFTCPGEGKKGQAVRLTPR